MTGDRDEASIHGDPEFQVITDIINELSETFDRSSATEGESLAEGIARVTRVTDAVVDHEILTHAAMHEAMRLGRPYIPEQILPMMLVPMIRLWYQGFLIGAKYQARKDADLISLPDDFDVSDFMPGTPKSQVVRSMLGDDTPAFDTALDETTTPDSLFGPPDIRAMVERDVPDPAQVQAVQELPEDKRRSLFQSILRKGDATTSSE